MKRTFLKIFALLLVSVTLGFAQGAAGGSAGAATGAAPQSAGATSMRTPLFLGGALGFGSGTGVGGERGLGLRQIEPMIGLWYPGLGYFRVGYGLYDYDEGADDGEDYEVEHSDFDIELAVNLLGDFYVLGTYSRVKELSDLGDVAWNEWGLGFGSLLNLFSRTMLFAEVEYRWVLDHYDPFMDKNVNGSRLQFNLGFAVYVF